MPPRGFWVLLAGLVLTSVLPVDTPLPRTHTHKSDVVLHPVGLQEPFIHYLVYRLLSRGLWDKNTAEKQVKIGPELLEVL